MCESKRGARARRELTRCGNASERGPRLDQLSFGALKPATYRRFKTSQGMGE